MNHYFEATSVPGCEAIKFSRLSAAKESPRETFLPAGAQERAQVHIQLSYNPPAGAVGHAVAALFGADSKTEMDEDLMQMKTMIETGIPPRDAAQSHTSTRGATNRQS